jgi:hypothetical protein
MLGQKRKIGDNNAKTELEGTYSKAFDNFFALLNDKKITIETKKYLDLNLLRNTNGAFQGELSSTVTGTPNLLVDRLNNIPPKSIKTESGEETEPMDLELLKNIIAKLITYCQQYGPTLVEKGHRDTDQQININNADNDTYYTKQLENLQQAVCKLDLLFPDANLGRFIAFISKPEGYNPGYNPEHFAEWNTYKLRMIDRLRNFCGIRGGKKKTKRRSKRNIKRLRSKKHKRGHNKLNKRV